MKRTLSLLLGVSIVLSLPSVASAGGAVAASQQRKQAVAQQQVILQQQILMQQQLQQQAASDAASPPEKVEDVVDITDLWKSFERDSTAWALIMDQDAKVMTVAHYIELLAKQGVEIHNPPQHYAAMIDSLAVQTPDMLRTSFDRVLSLMAILEYDYGNGEDPDAFALKFLGRERYLENRQRLGLPIQ